MHTFIRRFLDKIRDSKHLNHSRHTEAFEECTDHLEIETGDSYHLRVRPNTWRRLYPLQDAFSQELDNGGPPTSPTSKLQSIPNPLII